MNKFRAPSSLRWRISVEWKSITKCVRQTTKTHTISAGQIIIFKAGQLSAVLVWISLLHNNWKRVHTHHASSSSSHFFLNSELCLTMGLKNRSPLSKIIVFDWGKCSVECDWFNKSALTDWPFAWLDDTICPSTYVDRYQIDRVDKMPEHVSIFTYRHVVFNWPFRRSAHWLFCLTSSSSSLQFQNLFADVARYAAHCLREASKYGEVSSFYNPVEEQRVFESLLLLFAGFGGAAHGVLF